MQMIINYIIFQVVEQKAEQVPEQKPQPAVADNNYISAVLIVKQNHSTSSMIIKSNTKEGNSKENRNNHL